MLRTLALLALLGLAAPFHRAPVGRRPAATRVNMVFDFFNKVKEGADVLEKNLREVDKNFQKFADGLEKSRKKFLNDLEGIFNNKNGLEENLERLEEVLMMADLGATTTLDIIDDVRTLAKDAPEALDSDGVKSVLRERLLATLEGTTGRALNLQPKGEGPTVIFVLGANGMGKTTTIGKLAQRLRVEGEQKVLLCAGDTFRAAAVDQLETWAERAEVDIEVPPPDYKGGPQPVVAAAVDRALEGEYDILIVDTSGRLANNFDLNEELKDIKKEIVKRVPGAPHETLLVVDGALGRNAVDQASTWNEEVGLSGMVVTKLDGTARGGFVVPTVRELGIPIKLVGVGEGIDDLRDFAPEAFVDALLGYEEGEASMLQTKLDGMRKRVAEKKAAEKAKRDAESKKMEDQIKQGMSRGMNAMGGGGEPASADNFTFLDDEPEAGGSSKAKAKKKKKKKKTKKR